MRSLRRVLEWLRDLDARYGYVKRVRVMPGDPAPVRLRRVADTSEVVLVQPVTPVRTPPPAPRPLAPPVDVETGPIPVLTPSAEEVEAELAALETEDTPADPPRGWAEPEAEDDEDADVEDELEAEEEAELGEELAAVDEADPPTSVLPTVEPRAPHPEAINRLRSHRPD